MTKKQNYKKLIYSLLALFLLVVTVIGGWGILPAFADISGYSGVLDDLQKDGNFNVADYPDNAKDYSIQVIQIAESTDGELFLYTYQPCQKTKYLVATDINMSLSENVDGTKLYGLTLVSVDGVLCKYKVNGVTVSKEAKRYYNITSIYRKWDKDIDGEVTGGNTASGKSYSVGRLFCAKTVNGQVSYAWTFEQIVEILNPYAGVIRYSNGFKLYNDACDSHYIAFSTDWNIDFLAEATLSFSVTHWFRDYQALHILNKGTETFTDYSVRYDEEGQNEADGWRGKKYIWKRIESVESFKNDPQNVFSEEALSCLDDKQWVIRFYETPWTDSTRMHTWYTVHDVTILRLNFYSNGDCYDLGAVSDRINERPDDPDNENTDEKENFFVWLARLWCMPLWAVKLIFVLIILFPIFFIVLPILSAVFPAVRVVCKQILKFVWYVICLPFRGIAWIFKKIFKRE